MIINERYIADIDDEDDDDGKIENNNINFKVDRIISNYIYNKVNKGGLNP